MPSSLKSSGQKAQSNRTLSRFDRGSADILRHFPPSSNSSIISLQLLFFALLEILSLHLTDNDPIKSRLLFQLQLYFLQSSKILPTSTSLSAGSIRQLPLFQNYVRILRDSIQTALGVVQQPSSASSDGSTITSLLEKEYQKVLLTTASPANISIDIPQADIRLKVPLPLTMNGTMTPNEFDNVVIFRYVQDFFELDKLGKGAFGSVFRARNRLDDRLYAIKKIVFSENTDRTRRQAKCALREVRVLASLSHPNIVQYHCAWLELVPVEARTRTRGTSPPSSHLKTSLPQIKQPDSLDELIHFDGQSSSSHAKQNGDSEVKSSHRSSTASTSRDGDEDTAETSAFDSLEKHSDLEQYHSDGDHPSSSRSKTPFHHSKSCVETASDEHSANRELIPLHSRNQTLHPMIQSNYVNAKIVLFIQMQLCDTTLYDWLRYRDQAILGDSEQDLSRSLNDLGQYQCWRIFKQILTAVEYLHSQAFVHRDIKPRNIFLTYDKNDPSSMTVKLGDFGLATLLDSPSSPDASEQIKSDESTGVGTALYAPPEQLNASRCAPSSKSDSYSLGIVLFELFNVFPTEMERHSCLSDLRPKAKVDERFAQSYPFESQLIEQLVSVEAEKRPTVEQVLQIYGKEIQQRTRRAQTMTKQMLIEQLQEQLRERDRRIEELELNLKQITL